MEVSDALHELTWTFSLKYPIVSAPMANRSGGVLVSALRTAH
jgi:hypothetical protein